MTPEPEPCVFVDPYGFVFTCEQYPTIGDPCAAGNRLYSLFPCEATDEPLDQWCERFAEHPVCNQQPTLPPTGNEAWVATGVGLAFVFVGMVFVRAMRPRRHLDQ